MYTDTRVKTVPKSAWIYQGYGYYYDSACTKVYRAPAASQWQFVNLELENKSVTSVRGPRPTGRRITCNPFVLQNKSYALQPGIPLSEALTSNPEYIGGLWKKYFLWGDIEEVLLSYWASYPPTLTLPDIRERDRNYALQKAYAKINETTAMLGVTLGEMAETLAMIRNPLATLRKFLVKVWKKRNLKGFSDGVAKDTWLEYRYGIMPAILDTNSIINAINEKASKIYQSKASVRTNLGTTTSYVNLSWAYFVPKFRIEHSQVLKTSVGLYFNPINRQQYGLAATQILPSMIELIPYSFIWNWFIDVDTWINALMGSFTTPIAGYVTQKQSTIVKAIYDGPIGARYGAQADKIAKRYIIRRQDKVVRSMDLKCDLLTVHLNNAYTRSWRRMVDSVALGWDVPGKIIKSLK